MPPLYRSEPHPCPYREGLTAVNRMFFSTDVDPETWAGLLETGWRRFGTLFFRPDCPGCRECKPIRVPVRDFIPSSSQRKALNRNRDSVYGIINIRELLSRTPTKDERQLVEAAWMIYQRHGELRFHSQKDDYGTFVETFFTPSVESWFCPLFTGNRLAGSGFVDVSPRGLSSVYFSFDPFFGRLSPGTFSALKEIELTLQKGLDYYYLGYWVPGSPAMAYKARFRPHELYDWDTARWHLP